MKRLVLSVLLAGVALTVAAVPGFSSGSMNGSGGVMPAYYDSTLFNINFKELPPAAEKALIAHNASINFIYQSDPGLPGNQPFISVLDAIQGDGFNPLWVEVQITFNAGFTPHQLFSDNQVLAAAKTGEITLTTTDELYRCSVIGGPRGGTSPMSAPSASLKLFGAPDSRSTTWSAVKSGF